MHRLFQKQGLNNKLHKIKDIKLCSKLQNDTILEISVDAICPKYDLEKNVLVILSVETTS